MWNENEMELARMHVSSYFWMCVCIREPTQSYHMDECMYIFVDLPNVVWYALHISMHWRMWMKTMQFCQYKKHCTIHWRHALSLSCSPFSSLDVCVCVPLCMWILFKCTFPLMLNAPWHWFIRFAVFVCRTANNIRIKFAHTLTYPLVRWLA